MGYRMVRAFPAEQQIATPKMTIEARIRMPEDDTFCIVCEHWKETSYPGTADAYLSGTRDWVCPDCVIRIDPDLAGFIQHPEGHKRRIRRLPDFSRGYWGTCPECGTDGHFLNVGPDHWFICERHGLRWFGGANLFSGWREEGEEVWNRNRETLARFRELDPLGVGKPRYSLRARLHSLPGDFMRWIHRLRLRRRPVPQEESPF